MVDHGQAEGDLFSGVRGRILRNFLAWGLGFAVAKYQNENWYVSLAPVLQSIAKAIRDKWPGKFEWLPF